VTDRARFFYDYVDPLSYLLDVSIRALEAELGPLVDRHPFEMRAPPAELIDPEDPLWSARWETALASAGEHKIRLVAAPLIPWTHKAHELALHAAEKERFDDVHAAIFRASLEKGMDVGRVDVLVGIARELGLDATETKAVLDVDRHAAAVDGLRGEAERLGVRGVPTLLHEGQLIEGWMDDGALRARLTPAAGKKNTPDR
jgi:predicted DsbA family dithiol-disulfide isomerase